VLKIRCTGAWRSGGISGRGFRGSRQNFKISKFFYLGTVPPLAYLSINSFRGCRGWGAGLSFSAIPPDFSPRRSESRSSRLTPRLTQPRRPSGSIRRACPPHPRQPLNCRSPQPARRPHRIRGALGQAISHAVRHTANYSQSKKKTRGIVGGLSKAN
jgi:hypothetical protein